MKRDAKTVASWGFERIIPCHGVSVVCSAIRQVETDARGALGRYREKRKRCLDEFIQVLSAKRSVGFEITLCMNK
jgi:hypothetical protein